MTRESLTKRTRDFEDWYRSGFGQRATGSHRLIFQVATLFKDSGIRSVLDVGCGYGKIVKGLAWQGFEVTGTEIVPFLLNGPLKQMMILPYSIDGLSRLEEKSFDAVILCDLLDHLRDEEEVEQTIIEAERLSKIGVFITLGESCSVSTIDRPIQWWTGLVLDHVGGLIETQRDRDGRFLISMWKNR